MKIIVVGSIEAGVSAAGKILAASPDASNSIKVFERGSYYSCGNFGLPHYLTESLQSLTEAIREKEELLRSEGIEAFTEHEVLRINTAGHTLEVRDNRGGRNFTEEYDALVLATGSLGILPRVRGADKLGIHFLKNVSDLVFLKEFTRTPYVRDICILGSGYASLEIAKAFNKLGRNVRIIDEYSHMLPDFDADVSSLIEEIMTEKGIGFSGGRTVTAFEGRTFIEKLVTSRESFDCDLCIVTRGGKPNTALAGEAGIELSASGAILIDGELKTSVEGVYAVGDCAERRDGLLGTVSLHIGELETGKTGLTEGQARKAGLRVKSVTAKAYDRPGICPGSVEITIKLVFEERTGRILGAQAWGRKNAAARINSIAVAIAAGMCVKQLSEVDLVYSSSASSIWDPIQVVCNAAKKQVAGKM